MARPEGRAPLARPWPAIEGGDPHALDQRTHVVATECLAFAAEQVPQHPTPSKRQLEMQRVQATHHAEVRRRRFPRRVIHGRAREAKHGRSARVGQAVVPIDHRLALDPPQT